MKNRILRVNRGCFFYLLGYALYIVYLFYIRSGYSQFLHSVIISRGLRVVACFALLAHCLLNSKWKVRFVTMFIFGMLMYCVIYDWISVGNTDILFLALFGMLGVSIPFEKILLTLKNVSIVCLSVVFFSCSIGILDNIQYVHSTVGVTANTLGFNYYSFPHTMITLILVINLLQKNEQCRLKDYILMVIISHLAYRIFTTRLCYYEILIFIIINAMVFNVKYIAFRARIWKLVALLLYPVCCITSLILSINFNRINTWWYFIDIILSGRLSMMQRAYERYGIHLFGQEVEKIGNVEKRLNTSLIGSIYVDNGYMNSLLSYGILFTIIILILIIILFRYAYITNNKTVYIWMFIYAFLNMSNDFLVSPVVNPMLIYAFGVTYSGFKSVKNINYKRKLSFDTMSP